MLLPITESGLSPELAGDLNGVDAGRLPPGPLIAGAMDGAVMRAAERDRKFIACFAAERARLHKSDVMRIRGFAAAQQARLLHYRWHATSSRPCGTCRIACRPGPIRRPARHPR